nr:sodium-dependent glucose transporter 1 [Taeniopygia guttata]
MSLPSGEPRSQEEPPAEEEAAASPPGSDPAPLPAAPPAAAGAVRGAGRRCSGPERPPEPAAGAMAAADRELRVPFIQAEEAGAGAAGGGRRCGRCAAGPALRWCISGTLCASFLGLGLSIAVLGPTFPTLAANVGKNVSDIYYIFVGRSLGSLGGSVVGGVLLDCMNASLLLALSMLGTMSGLYAIPWCKESLLLTILMSVIGGSIGILDTGGNVLALYTWGSEAGPHLQALHFSFAVGAFLAPIVAQMDSRSSEPEELAGAEKTNQSVLKSVPTASAASTTPALNDHHNEGFLWSYIFIGTYILFVSFFFFVLYSKSSSARDKAKAPVQDRLAKYHWPIVGLLFVFFFFYVGAEVTYGSYVFTYAMVFTEMTESQAAALNSIFWGMFAVCRGAAIFGAALLSPDTMIVVSLLCSAASSTALAFFAHYRAALWVGTAVYGASMATIFPSGIAWIEQYTAVEGKTASLFVVGAALGEMCIPVAVGYLQGRYHHVPVVMYTVFVISIVTVLLFPAMYKLANWPQQWDLQEVSDRETRKTLLSNSRLTEDEEEEEHVRERNDADFEVIEINDKQKNSLTDTSCRIPGDSPAEISLQPHLDDALGNSPVIADGSPGKQNGSVDWEKSE